MSLRLGFGKLVNVGIHILPSITSKELLFCIIPQRILSAQIARNYSDRFSITPKKKKIRSVWRYRWWGGRYLHGGGGPQVGEVPLLGGLTCLSM